MMKHWLRSGRRSELWTWLHSAAGGFLDSLTTTHTKVHEARYRRFPSCILAPFVVKLGHYLAAGLIALTASAVAQEDSGATSSSLTYRVSATITYYCPVEKTLNLHELIFDFHNDSCQDSRQVAERKTPTLPYGPLYRNVRISGYHWIDWGEGHPSPYSRHDAKIEITKTATTLSASGSLAKASCSQSASGKGVVEDSFWQAKAVPEVTLLDEEQHPQLPVEAEIVPPQSSAVLKFPAGCSGDREPALQYAVTPLLNGVAQAAMYTSPLLTAGKSATEKDAALGATSIHARWSPQTSGENSGESELTVTISGSGKKQPAPAP